jgi:hypothetical protein
MFFLWLSEGVSGLGNQTFSQSLSSGISRFPALTPRQVDRGRLLGLVMSLGVGLVGLAGSRRVVRWLWSAVDTSGGCAADSLVAGVDPCKVPRVVRGLWWGSWLLFLAVWASHAYCIHLFEASPGTSVGASQAAFSLLQESCTEAIAVTFLTVGLGGAGFFLLRGALLCLGQALTGSFLVILGGLLVALSILVGGVLVLVHLSG